MTSFFHYDGLGSTRSLSDSSGNLTDTYNYEAFGELLNLTGTTDNNYLFAGEQLDANLEQYYLRARYYDQGIGRFTQQDTWMGNSSDPVTLHKYLYAGADGVNHIDPSGYFHIGDFMSAQTMQTELQTTQAVISFLGISVVMSNFNSLSYMEVQPQRAASHLSIGIAKLKVKQCQGGAISSCNAGIPVIFYGSDVMDVTMNIYSAITEKGASPVLQRIYPAHRRGWMHSPSRSNAECGGLTGGKTGKECDEYPFASSAQGGEANYRGGAGTVRITPALKAHNRRAGGLLGGIGGLYQKCDVQKNDPIKGWYGVIPIPSGQSNVQCVPD